MSPYTTCLSCNVVFLTAVGWFASAMLGIAAACFVDRRRFLHGLRSQILMARDEVERSSDDEGRDKSRPNSIESTWSRLIPAIRKTVFDAMPHLIFPHESSRLREFLRYLASLDITSELDDGMESLARQVALGEDIRTKKTVLLAALDRLESYIG